jgi:hypothetical protein
MATDVVEKARSNEALVAREIDDGESENAKVICDVRIFQAVRASDDEEGSSEKPRGLCDETVHCSLLAERLEIVLSAWCP